MYNPNSINHYFEYDGFEFTVSVYDYSSGSNKDQYLQECIFEYSTNDKDYYKLMRISTPRQERTGITTINFSDKLPYALIQFHHVTIIPDNLSKRWGEASRKLLQVKVPNEGIEGVVNFIWRFEPTSNIRFVRISGTWIDCEKNRTESFQHVVYDLKRYLNYHLKSNYPEVNTKVRRNNTAKMLKKSDAIVINGANPCANIKVYNTSGTVVKSVISK